MANKQNTNYLYIDSDAALRELCEELQSAQVIAVDTEFMREKTYFAQLCLIQLASATHIACIDPLKIKDLQPLQNLLMAPGTIKLFHAARQDLEIFYDMWQLVPQPVFDTQIAAALLGYSDQVGYANLMESLLGVQLDKSASRTDWSKRPLEESQLDYAADDVRYLLQAYPVISHKLEELGRLDWLDEDFSELVKASLYDKDPSSSWQRVSGHGKLKATQLAILQQLASWREQQARKKDKPRKWILSDDLLVQIARQAPKSIEQLKRIRGIPDNLLKQFGDEIISYVTSALALDKDQLPSLPSVQRLSITQECLADTMMAYLKVLSSNNKINAAILATRKEVDKLARGERESSVLHGWRRHVAGQPLLDLIEGRISLHVVDGVVIAESSKTS